MGLACRAGLRLGQDGKKCVDIDECAEGTALCDQQCVNKDPRDSGLPYACKCRSGYSIDIEDKHKCIPEVSTARTASAVRLPCMLSSQAVTSAFKRCGEDSQH